MNKRTVTAASLSALLALGGTAAIAAAQDESDPADDTTAKQAAIGTIELVVGEDGSTTYYLNVDGSLVELQFGPSWFTDIAARFGVSEGDEVEIGGNLRDGMPNENASDVAKEKAAKAPRLKIKSINGEPRPEGKPVWARGPKAQGEAHPGHKGWSKGQAKKAENKVETSGAAQAPGQEMGKPGQGRGKKDK